MPTNSVYGTVQEDEEQQKATATNTGAGQTQQTVTAPTVAPPPPPPPPSPTGGMFQTQNTTPQGTGSNLGGQIQDYASDFMNNPTRWDLPQVQGAVDLMEQNMARQQERSVRDMDAYYSKRGVVGSNIEEEGRRDLLSQQAAERNGFMMDLLNAYSSTQGSDRALAGRFGLDVQGTQGSLELSREQMALDAGLRTRALDLQEQGMSSDEAFRQAKLEQDGAIQQRSLDLQQMGMEADEAYRYAALEQDSEFRAEALRLQEMGLSQQDSYRYAELALRESQGNRELDIREDDLSQQRRMEELLMMFNAIQSGMSAEDFRAALGAASEGGTGSVPVPGDPSTWTEEWIRSNYGDGPVGNAMIEAMNANQGG